MPPGEKAPPEKPTDLDNLSEDELGALLDEAAEQALG